MAEQVDAGGENRKRSPVGLQPMSRFESGLSPILKIIMIEDHLHYYRATVFKVSDGDSVTLHIDLGLCAWLMEQKIRFSLIDAPELKGEERPAGLLAAAVLRERILGKQVIIKTEKNTRGKEKKELYGRWLVTIYLDGEDINQWMLDNGYAVIWGISK